jgi:tetratricopeptide (TPR) repeat protein
MRNARPPEDPAITAERNQWKERLKEKPDDAPLNYLYAEFCRKQDAHEEAKIHGEKALAAEPENPNYQGFMVTIYLNLREFAPALELTRRRVQKDPQNPWLWSLMASAQEGLGKMDDAIASSRNAIRLLPKERILRTDHVQLLRGAQRPDEILKFVEETKAEDPGFPNLDGWKFAALKDTGRYEEALEIARMRAEKESDDVRNWEQVAMLLDLLNKTKEADEVRDRIREIGRQGKASFFTREITQRGPLHLIVNESLAPSDQPDRYKFTFFLHQNGVYWDNAQVYLRLDPAKGEAREPAGIKPGDNYYLLAFYSPCNCI